MSNINLIKAKKAKDDEFYTQYETIVKEIGKCWRPEIFKDKIIYCPCDTDESNFVKFFKDNKDFYGYKKLLYTSINDGVSFDSDYCKELMKKCDIVVTNPPFSMFRQFYKQLLDLGKDFIILGPSTAINYEEVFNSIKDEKVFIGESISNGHTKFIKPDGSLKEVNVRWFTTKWNLGSWFKSGIKFDKNSTEYLDNTDIPCFNRKKDIPDDYNGFMSVPITFLDNIHKNQFEIIGLAMANRYYGDIQCYSRVCGQSKFSRLIVKRKLQCNDETKEILEV